MAKTTEKETDWKSIPVVHDLYDVFGNCAAVNYAVLTDPDCDTFHFLVDAGYTDCIVRIASKEYDQLYLAAMKKTGFLFIVFGAGAQALRTLEELEHDKKRKTQG